MELAPTVHIRFQPKPMAISIGYRLHLKLAFIVLILRLNSKDSKASALKLQFFVWALKDSKNTVRVRDFVSSKFTTNLEFWGLEPALSRALDFAVSERIINIEKGLYTLAPKGQEFFQAILKETDILQPEKAFLIAIGRSISDNRLAKIATWAQQNAED